MRKQSNNIFMGTLLAIAVIAGIGSMNSKNTKTNDNLISDNQSVIGTEEELPYEVSVENVNSGLILGMASEPNEQVTEEETTTEEITTEDITTEEETTTEVVTEPITEAPTEAWTEPITEAPTEPITEAPTPAPTEIYTELATEAPVYVDWKYVFVGDSRTKGLEAALTKYGLKNYKQTFISEIGEGYYFLMNNMATIKACCDSSTVLVVALGINDMQWCYNKYIAAMNDMAATMNCQIYFMLVTPVNEATEAAGGKFHIKNADIDLFNARMLSGLDPRIHIIDGNSYLKNVIVDYTTMDGVHYTDETYMILYNYMMQFLPHN